MESSAAPLPSRIGKYEVTAELGRGAMGVVFRAWDPMIEREVALKTMARELVASEEQRERFLREAKAAGGLRHWNIVTVYELGMDGDLAFIAMELLEGTDLKRLLYEGRMGLRERLRILEAVLDGIDYAHRRGIVHRDLKPANVHVGTDGAVKIVDFGIARLQSSDVTKTGQLMGTPSYMSPEQVAGRHVDGRSDVFSLGVMLYELVADRRPFDGESVATIIHRILNEAPAVMPGSVPAELQDVVLRALAKSPDERYQSAGEMLAALRSAAAAIDRLEKTWVLPAGATVSIHELTTRHLAPPAPVARRAPGVLRIALGGIGAVALGLIVVYLAFGRPPRDTSGMRTLEPRGDHAVAAPPPAGAQEPSGASGPRATMPATPRPDIEAASTVLATAEAPAPSPVAPPATASSASGPDASPPAPTPVRTLPPRKEPSRVAVVVPSPLPATPSIVTVTEPPPQPPAPPTASRPARWEALGDVKSVGAEPVMMPPARTEAVPARSESQTLIRAAQAAFEDCDFRGALRTAKQIRQIAPDDPWLLANLATIEKKARDQEITQAALSEGERLLADGDMEGAHRALERASEHAPACMSGRVSDARMRLAEQGRPFLKQNP
ncbi:MAG: serine/threonine-protein kinase [Acidobacteriota bacterium]